MTDGDLDAGIRATEQTPTGVPSILTRVASMADASSTGSPPVVAVCAGSYARGASVASIPRNGDTAGCESDGGSWQHVRAASVVPR
jgi:hypothetical protein